MPLTAETQGRGAFHLRYLLLSPGSPSCCSYVSQLTGQEQHISNSMLPMGPSRPADSPVLACGGGEEKKLLPHP